MNDLGLGKSLLNPKHSNIATINSLPRNTKANSQKTNFMMEKMAPIMIPTANIPFRMKIVDVFKVLKRMLGLSVKTYLYFSFPNRTAEYSILATPHKKQIGHSTIIYLKIGCRLELSAMVNTGTTIEISNIVEIH